MLEELFKPYKIGKTTIRNRIVMPPMVTFLANENGAVTRRMMDYYSERARGGVGLIIVESAYVREEDRDMGRLGIENPQLQPGLSELAESIQERGAKAFLQLNHRGSVLSIKKGKGPDDLSLDEIETLIEAFSSAAERAQKAGFDGVEIHGANIYLIAQFLSPLTNHRLDAYGQTLEGRMKLPLAVVRRVRQKVGDDYPVLFRMVGHQYTEGGLNLEDTKVIARRMEEAGVSSLHVVAGSPSAPYWHCPPMAIPPGCHVPLAQEMKKVVRLPVIAVGRIHHPFLANRILEEGKADLIAMGRPLIADPYLPRKAREGKIESIRFCLSCNSCRKRVIHLQRTIRCAVNAEAGREREARIFPSPAPKRVMVIGGGPGGMESARVLALRGHRVTLWEKEDCLGGQVNLAILPPHKEELKNILAFLIPQMMRLNIEIRTGREVTRETLEEENPEIVILAAGASPWIPEIPGLDREMIFTPAEALQGVRPLGQRILVSGGGMVGCEVAEFLAGKKKRVTLVEKLPEIAMGMEGYTKNLLLERLKMLEVKVITEGEVISFRGKEAHVRVKGEMASLQADAWVAAMGVQPNNSLEKFLRQFGRTFFSIGDCREGGDVAAAIDEGFRSALEV